MNTRYCCLFVFLLLNTLNRIAAEERTYNILFIQSYDTQSPWRESLNKGLAKGFKENGLKVNITTEYLDADFWTSESRKVLVRRFCERARNRKTDLIVTVDDEAFQSLFACGDSLPFRTPVVFFGIKYPDRKMIATHLNVCGFSAGPDFLAILYRAQDLFPQRKEIICLVDDNFLAQKGYANLIDDWENFKERNPDYNLKVYNTKDETAHLIIESICYPYNASGRIVLVPRWSQFFSFVGKNSKAPFFSCQKRSLKKGAFAAYDADAYLSSQLVAQRASLILKGATPHSFGITDISPGFVYDYKQLCFFGVSPEKADSSGTIINKPYWEKYKLVFLFLYPSMLLFLIVFVIWLIRLNLRESKRRTHAQTRLLIQNKMVEQRDEFYNIFHSIPHGIITYDTNLNIHFTNRALLRMLHLPYESGGWLYKGMAADSLFKIYCNGEEILHKLLEQVLKNNSSVVIPPSSFMKEAHSEIYFPVSGELVPIRSKKLIIGVALSARNVSDQEMQKRLFDMALQESSIYPWQYDVVGRFFIFPPGFLMRFGYDKSATIIYRNELERIIHPDDLKLISFSLDRFCAVEEIAGSLILRQLNADGEYEWWEYCASATTGLTKNTLYNILGVCQSIQMYKTIEQDMKEARDKALQADKLKSAFLANMSHEIRTPLNAIVGFSDLLRNVNDFTSEEFQQFIKTINQNCGLLLALINDILDLSRIESGTMEFKFKRHSLPLLLQTVYDSQLLNMPPGVDLVLQIPPNDGKYLVTDHIRLQQVINNLVNNAIKFTNKGSVTFGYEEDQDTGYIRLFVKDTGTGISGEDINHIFEHFYKVDNFTQGAGLGLSICQTIVKELKGDITVSSQFGVGTRFTVSIPNIQECPNVHS